MSQIQNIKPDDITAGCDRCGGFIPDTRQVKYCCSGKDCGCHGRPMDEILCDDCMQEDLIKSNQSWEN